MKAFFERCASTCSRALGSYQAFILCSILILIWFVWALQQHFKPESQIPMGTFSAVITTCAVFLIQNESNRSSKALHAKLDELIRAIKEARNDFRQAENLPEEEIEKLRESE